MANPIKAKKSTNSPFNQELQRIEKNLFDELEDLISIFNDEFECEYINEKALEKILGYSFEEIKGKNSLKIVHPNDLEKVKKNFNIAFKKGKGYGETRIKHKNGNYKWLQSNGKICMKNGIKKLILISRDITNQKEIESKLKKQIIELEKLNELKSDILRRAAHELKTPLITIKGFAELSINKFGNECDPDFLSYLVNIIKGCNRLDNMVKNVIKSSKLESCKVDLIFSKENLSNCINLCIEELRKLLEERNHSIILDLPNELYLNFDKEQINIVLMNLLKNAIIYTPHNGIIKIQAAIKSNFIIISIKDNGLGFSEEEKKQLFKQFGKIDRSNFNIDLGIEGSGLGLYITKKIVELHGGEIWVESEGRNKGSTFYFSLPLKRR